VKTTTATFSVSFPDEAISDLRRRLAGTRWPDQLPDSAWELGTDLDYLRDLCAYWAADFDWAAAQGRLNAWPQITTVIDGQTIHAIHARAEGPDALPLLVLHGWPGSVAEMLKIIGPLCRPADDRDAFHVVCASLPGFGFSGPTHERGWNIRRVAAAMVELMQRLGYPRFAALGGDWGATTSNYLALDHPEHLVAIYLTMAAAGPPPGSDGSELSDTEREWVAQSAAFFQQESGYLQMQGTRPQTLAYGLTDSPAGLAGWMVEKFRAWSDCHGDLESAISRDELLTNLSVYWMTGTANSASRIYYEAMQAGEFQPIGTRIEVPTACAIFPKETVRAPRPWAEYAWNLQHWSEMPRGGHFAALEVPELLVADVRSFYRLRRN
jgi:pimeloyl-ACP methyl ester carboxylesterase